MLREHSGDFLMALLAEPLPPAKAQPGLFNRSCSVAGHVPLALPEREPRGFGGGSAACGARVPLVLIERGNRGGGEGGPFAAPEFHASLLGGQSIVRDKRHGGGLRSGQHGDDGDHSDSKRGQYQKSLQPAVFGQVSGSMGMGMMRRHVDLLEREETLGSFRQRFRFLRRRSFLKDKNTIALKASAINRVAAVLSLFLSLARS
jgi:hypothetical protein